MPRAFPPTARFAPDERTLDPRSELPSPPPIPNPSEDTTPFLFIFVCVERASAKTGSRIQETGYISLRQPWMGRNTTSELNHSGSQAPGSPGGAAFPACRLVDDPARG